MPKHILLPLNRFRGKSGSAIPAHPSVDHASLQPIMDPPVRSGTGDSAAFFGNDNALSRRPKVPHGTQRRHLRGLFVAREHSDKLSREQNAPFRSRDDLGRLFREQNAPSRSRDHLGRPLREQNAPSRSRDHLGRPFREQNAAFHSRDNLGAVVRYGDSTGAPQCRRGETRASATHRETWCLSGR